jgi:hypothetical protein
MLSSRLSDLELRLMTEPSSKLARNNQGQSKKATPSERAATGSANREALRENASIKARQESLSRESKGGREEIGNTKPPSRVEPSRRNTAPKLTTTKSTDLPRQNRRVSNEPHFEVPSGGVRSAKIRATHAPKTSFTAGLTKKTSPARAEEKRVEHTTSARSFEPVNNVAFEAAAETALSFCLKSMAFTARWMSGGFWLASNLARARDLSQVVELQTAYWRRQFDEVTAQIEESQSFVRKFLTGNR